MNGPHKILIVGELNAGKTSLVRRFSHGIFEDKYCATLGVDFSMKTLQIKEGLSVILHLWDVGGQERFSSLTRAYFRDATACVVIFDITSRRSFEGAAKWKEDIDSKVVRGDGSPIPALLLGNKCDLPERPVSEEEIKKFAIEHGFRGWSPVSALSNSHIENSFRFIVAEILREFDPNAYRGPAGFALRSDNETKSGDCC